MGPNGTSYTSLFMKVVCLFVCHGEIFQTMKPLATLLVNEIVNKKVILKWGRTHGLEVNELLG